MSQTVERAFRKKRKGRRKIPAVLLILALGCLLSGCGRVVFVTGLDRDELFSVGERTGSVTEVQIYLVTMQNQYLATYGDDVFTREGNETVADSLRENALERLVKVKTLCGIADACGIAGDETDQARAARAAARYMESLGEAERSYLNAGETLISEMYAEYDLAQQMAQELVADVDTEVSDEEARTVTVQSILIKTYRTGEDGSRVEFTDEEKQEALERAQAIREEIQYGMDNYLGITFVTYMAQYNEDSVTTYTFGKGEVDSAFEEAAFRQEVGTISDVVETKDGYRIIKVISVSDEEEMETRKEIIRKERIESAYEEAYDAWAEQLEYGLNADRWEEVTLCEDPEVTTSEFFEIYNEVFGA